MTAALNLLKRKNERIAKALIPVKAKRSRSGENGGVMNHAIDNLMKEHQLILRVLASFNSLAGELRNGRSVSRRDVADFVSFFREFADKCHHVKEEDCLFVAMNQIGFARESGPIAVMLSEHTAGRSLVRALWEMAQLPGPLTAGEVRRIIAGVSEFVPLLSGHIGKEDNILYPMARSAIPGEQLLKLDADCEAFERRAMAPGEVAKLHELAARLIAAYPADSKQFETIAAGFSCH